MASHRFQYREIVPFIHLILPSEPFSGARSSNPCASHPINALHHAELKTSSWVQHRNATSWPNQTTPPSPVEFRDGMEARLRRESLLRPT